MNDFVFFEGRIFNKNFITCVYVQYRAYTEDVVAVCEVNGSKEPINLGAPTQDVTECEKIISNFYKALKGE